MECVLAEYAVGAAWMAWGNLFVAPTVAVAVVLAGGSWPVSIRTYG